MVSLMVCANERGGQGKVKMRHDRVVAFALVALCVLATSCLQAGASETAPAVTPVMTAPMATPGLAQPSPSPTVSQDPGAVLVSQRCTTCHSFGLAVSKRYNEAQWRRSVNQMVARGMQMTPAEQDQAVRYLTATYHP